jgi:hypothetical protein
MRASALVLAFVKRQSIAMLFFAQHHLVQLPQQAMGGWGLVPH